MDWRLMLDGDLPGHENMAVDSAMLRALEDGSGVPTVRIYGWSEPTISIGYLQDEAPFLGLGMPVVRRVTGGRAVVHSSEVTYAVVGLVDHPLFCGGIMGTYSVISACIMDALKKAGVEPAYSQGAPGKPRNEACFFSPSRYEVLVGGRKLVGSAQRRLKRAFIQHGSILMATDALLNEKVFGSGVCSRMAGVSEFSAVTREELRGFLARSFADGFKEAFVRVGLTPGEEAMKEALARRSLLTDGCPRASGAGR